MPTSDPLINWLVGLVIALVIALWLRLEHRLEQIDGKVDKLDGVAARHGAIIEIHGREIESLRGRKT